ncbi:hypothetical protein AAG747_18055 [Rapidithrix thailandica]|uniref:Peptide-N(4)-(N-acetyl-beta-glucosaminyl)asparagine amidase n=1 Tax=Rapidithrix thailandica TaxID=413964 RepID=A0AAW9SA27_9BACT
MYRYRSAITNYFHPVPEKVRTVLAAAEANREELQKVIEHYQNPEDSLKLKAAYFLIEHMYLHGNPNVSLNENASIDIFAYKEKPKDEVIRELDSLKRLGQIYFQRGKPTVDHHSVNAGLLIDNIEQAFTAWQLPWARQLNFQQFCEFILPYRAHQEPLEAGWRKYFRQKYLPAIDTLSLSNDLFAICKVINQDLQKDYGYKLARFYVPRELSLSEARRLGGGMCEDLTNVTTYAMRANGVPVAVDFTPFWPRTNYGHQWLALLSDKGTNQWFDGTYNHPKPDKTSRVVAKAYRYTYAAQANKLHQLRGQEEEVPGFMNLQNYRDVTALYTEVRDFTVSLERTLPDGHHIAYAAVFNVNTWKPIHWGKVENKKVTFTDMGKNVVYLPVGYQHGRTLPLTSPVLFTQNGTVKSLTPDITKRQTIQVEHYPHLRNGNAIEKGKNYALYYWDYDWIKVAKKQAKGTSITFENVPSNAVYRVVPEDQSEARIFLYQEGKQLMY